MTQFPERESLFRRWEEEHRGILLKVTRSYARSAAEIGELGQELRLQLWHSTRCFTGACKSSTWVYRVCLNTAISWHRSAVRREDSMERQTDLAEILAADRSPADSAADREIIQRLYASIHAMPEIDRALILLALDGLAYRDIADVMGLNENRVGVGLTRARKRLAQLMKGVAHELE
jgi:RNA polymerase sigma-70 factor (ECF subfamily)